MCLISKADGKGFLYLDVFRCLMTLAKAQDHLICFIKSAPSGVHKVRLPLFIVGTNDEDGQWIKERFRSKIFTHNSASYCHLVNHTDLFFDGRAAKNRRHFRMAQLSVKGRQFFRRKSKGCSAQVFFETAALPRPWNGHNIGLFL